MTHTCSRLKHFILLKRQIFNRTVQILWFMFTSRNQISSQISAPLHWPTQGFLYSGCRHESTFAQSTRLTCGWKELEITQKCEIAAQKANCILGCIRRSMAAGSDSNPLRSPETPPECCRQLWGPQYKEHCLLLTNTSKIISLCLMTLPLNVFHFKSSLYMIALVSKQTPTFEELQLKTNSLA